MIYFVRSGNRGPIKIGFTNGDVPSRIKQLQTGNPEKLTLMLELEGDEETEKDTHQRFSKLRLQGEWFSGKELIEWICGMGWIPDDLIYE